MAARLVVARTSIILGTSSSTTITNNIPRLLCSSPSTFTGARSAARPGSVPTLRARQTSSCWSSSSSIRRMASSAPAAAAPTDAPRTYEWLIVIPDKPGMMAKRVEVRAQHLEGLTKVVESGLIKMGGAILEDMPADDELSSMKFAGSTIMMVAESRQAVLDVLKEDIYVKSGVWDLEKIMIWPAKIAIRLP